MCKAVTEKITYRLSISMLVIILSLLAISIPLMITSYHDYIKTKNAVVEIQVLNTVADLANKISRERGPANKAMSSDAKQFSENRQALIEYRKALDQHLQLTVNALEQAGFHQLAQRLNRDVVQDLTRGRQHVDAYLDLPITKRNVEQFDQAILSMFSAWDTMHDVLKNVMMHAKNKDSSLTESYTLILILADLRDQAGRVASNVMAHVSFNAPLPSTNIARSLQTQKQVQYLWDLVYTIQPEEEKTTQFKALHTTLKTEFIDQGLPLVGRLIEESVQGKTYSLQGTELTDHISGKFATVINLQKYVLDDSLQRANRHLYVAKQKVVWTFSLATLSVLAALFTMIYARKKVFIPLIQARKMILSLVQYNGNVSTLDEEKYRKSSDFFALFEAIYKLKKMLVQRDAFESQLKSIATTDALTGVSNRVLLDEYIQQVEHDSALFSQLCLIVVDIDNFKTVNDQFGHSFGDSVIVEVASCLKQNVRHSDLIVRFGGDEFLVLIQDLPIDQAHELAEKIRKDVANLSIFIPNAEHALRVSVSIGVAGSSTSWKDLFQRADQSLFRAKALGKNKVAR